MGLSKETYSNYYLTMVFYAIMKYRNNDSDFVGCGIGIVTDSTIDMHIWFAIKKITP